MAKKINPAFLAEIDARLLKVENIQQEASIINNEADKESMNVINMPLNEDVNIEDKSIAKDQPLPLEEQSMNQGGGTWYTNAVSDMLNMMSGVINYSKSENISESSILQDIGALSLDNLPGSSDQVDDSAL